MAFASTISTIAPFGVEGDMRVSRGIYASSGGSTGGTVTTGLSQVFEFYITPSGSAVATNASVVNATPSASTPLSATGSVIIVTNSNQTGWWVAKGR